MSQHSVRRVRAKDTFEDTNQNLSCSQRQRSLWTCTGWHEEIRENVLFQKWDSKEFQKWKSYTSAKCSRELQTVMGEQRYIRFGNWVIVDLINSNFSTLMGAGRLTAMHWRQNGKHKGLHFFKKLKKYLPRLKKQKLSALTVLCKLSFRIHWLKKTLIKYPLYVRTHTIHQVIKMNERLVPPLKSLQLQRDIHPLPPLSPPKETAFHSTVIHCGIYSNRGRKTEPAIGSTDITGAGNGGRGGATW